MDVRNTAEMRKRIFGSTSINNKQMNIYNWTFYLRQTAAVRGIVCGLVFCECFILNFQKIKWRIFGRTFNIFVSCQNRGGKCVLSRIRRQTHQQQQNKTSFYARISKARISLDNAIKWRSYGGERYWNCFARPRSRAPPCIRNAILSFPKPFVHSMRIHLINKHTQCASASHSTKLNWLKRSVRQYNEWTSLWDDKNIFPMTRVRESPNLTVYVYLKQKKRTTNSDSHRGELGSVGGRNAVHVIRETKCLIICIHHGFVCMRRTSRISFIRAIASSAYSPRSGFLKFNGRLH